MNEVLDQVTPILAAVLLGILAVFVVLGMLFGMGRGLKRSALRLAIFGSLLLVAFFLTPVIIKSGLDLNITINGMTPVQWVDDLSDRLVVFLQEQFGDYVTPFQTYIKDYAMGIVLAVLNLVLFIGLYFTIKVVSWFIYAITAHFVAPKRNHEGQKNPKHVWWGLLVGALQGVMLFVFFMLPINGVIGVVSQAAQYQAAAAEDSTAQPAAASSETNTADDIAVALRKVDDSLTGYNNLLRYTGMQFLSNKAFEYQLTVRMNDKSKINLLHDINAGWELYVDAQTLDKVMNKFERAFSNGIDLTQITAEDYQFLRKFVNKAFDLQILQVADHLLSQLDEILNTPFADDQTYLDGTAVYADSFYGMLIKQNVTERVIPVDVAAGETAPTNYAQYAAGLRAMVNYVSEQKMNLLRDDILNVIDFLEVVGTYRVIYDGLSEPVTVATILNQDHFELRNYLDLATAKLAGDQGNYTDGTPLLKALSETLKQFSVVKMLGKTNVDNLVTYSKMFEGLASDVAGAETFLYDFVPLFLGDSAFTKTVADSTTVKGNWEKLIDLALEVAGTFRDYCTINDDIQAIKDRLMNEDAQLTADDAQIQAVIEYLASLVMTEADYNAHQAEFGTQTYEQVKFQKVDRLADAVYDVVNTFAPIKQFLLTQLNDMKTKNQNDYVDILVKMLENDKENWYKTLHSIVNAAKILDNSVLGDLVEVVQGMGELSGEELTAKLLDVVTDLKVEDVSEVIYTMLTIPEVGTTVQNVLTDTVNQICATDINYDKIFGAEDGATVKAQVADLQNYLQTFDSENATEADKEKLNTVVSDLWGTVGNNQNLKDYLAQMQQGQAA